MRATCLIFILHLTFIFPASAQDVSSTVTKTYKDYFELPRESVFLHLNKNIFFKGENIWFTGYVYHTKTGLPFLKTTNLYCGIYNSNGKLLTKKLFYVDNGVAFGTLSLDPSFGSGEFIVKLYTNWMKNFKEDNAFFQKIYVLNDTIITTQNAKKKYALHILPEGGNLVSEVLNTVGFRIESPDDTRKIIRRGFIVTENNEVILKNIKCNNDGIGKFSIRPSKNQRYYLKIELVNGDSITKILPEPKETGITISINNLFEDKVFVALRTNSRTFSKIQGNNFYLAIHRDGMIKAHEFVFDKTEKTISFSKKKLLTGTNIMTLFDNQLNPLLERLIFNERNLDFLKIEPNTEVLDKTNDSVKVRISLNHQNIKSGSLSVSVLPEETLANPEKSIISSFLLQPYFKNKVTNSSSFFHNINRSTLNNLDLLFLTLGWSRYEWKNIFEETPNRKFDFQRGITIKGQVLTPAENKKDQVIMFQPSLGSLLNANLAENKKFEFSNKYILKGETLNIGITNGKALKKNPNILLDFFPKIEQDSISSSDLNLDITTFVKPKKLNSNDEIIRTENTINLDSVIIQKKIVPELTKNKKLIGGTIEGKKINETDIKKHRKLSNLIKRLGFKVRSNSANSSFWILPKTRVDDPPIIILDDFRVDNNLTDYPLDSIDEIYYENFGTHGSGGGTVYIYRKYGEDFLETKKRLVKKMASEGFERPVDYYNPKFGTFVNKSFLNYGHIHWEPKLSFSNNKEVTITFPYYGLKGVKLFIEGMTENGKLISSINQVNFD
ncbi:hypothetical protein [Aquimarina celericrescens]|uniref:TonB-dependent receptor plug domain-containing protein n=1 Tax=Aquimarina celericrescens TaxID=1964542 RepID=A0ABW5AZ66_9FLAO|nr:hypothetical protein [Aquimarina celericrescens]